MDRNRFYGRLLIRKWAYRAEEVVISLYIIDNNAVGCYYANQTDA